MASEATRMKQCLFETVDKCPAFNGNVVLTTSNGRELVGESSSVDQCNVAKFLLNEFLFLRI